MWKGIFILEVGFYFVKLYVVVLIIKIRESGVSLSWEGEFMFLDIGTLNLRKIRYVKYSKIYKV